MPLPHQRTGSGASRREGHTGVEEDDGAQAAQLRLVHLHVPHLGHELRQHPAEEEADTPSQSGRGPHQGHTPDTQGLWEARRSRRVAEMGQAKARTARQPEREWAGTWARVPPLPGGWAPLLSLEVCLWGFILGT